MEARTPPRAAPHMDTTPAWAMSSLTQSCLPPHFSCFGISSGGWDLCLSPPNSHPSPTSSFPLYLLPSLLSTKSSLSFLFTFQFLCQQLGLHVPAPYCPGSLSHFPPPLSSPPQHAHPPVSPPPQSSSLSLLLPHLGLCAPSHAPQLPLLLPNLHPASPDRRSQVAYNPSLCFSITAAFF